MYYLGIDGGGTKTRYVLIDKNLKILSEIETGTIHIRQIGELKLKSELSEGIKKVCENAKIDKDDLEFIFLGMPGYGESKNDKDDIEKIVKEILDGKNYKIDNDCVAGWAAGTLCSEGINIVAGTGSIAFGMNDKGESGRVGGWGPTIGDDGSAYWIGLKIINEYTKQKDGRHKKSILVDIIEREKDIDDYFGIVNLIFNRYKLSRTEIAGFCRIAKIAADSGCEACRKIFEEAAYELFLQIKTLKDELNIIEEFTLSYTGGVFNAGDLILNPLNKYFKNENIKYKMNKPKITPWQGAALMAYKLAGNEIVQKDIEKVLA